MKYLITLIFFLHVLKGISQPVIQWQNTIGGSASDGIESVQQTSDGGYILGGASMSGISGDKTDTCRGDLDYWIVKINSSGSIEWQKTIGGTGSDILYSVHETFDHGYIVSGLSESDSSGEKDQNRMGATDFWILKLDSAGNILWQKTIGGADWELFGTIIQTIDGGYILGGSSVSNISGNKTENCIGSMDYWILKLDSIGTILWQKTIGGVDPDHLTSITETFDNGYLISGNSYSGISGNKTVLNYGMADYWLIKLNQAGTIEWQKSYGGLDADEPLNIISINTNSFLIGGISRSGISGNKTVSNKGSSDYWIIKINASGVIIWQQDFGGADYDDFCNVTLCGDTGFIVGGTSISNISGDKTEASHGGEDYWIIRTDSSGNIMWQKTIGGNSDDELFGLENSSNDGFLLGGTSYSNISGDKSENSLGASDFWLVKISSTNSVNLLNENSFEVFPNPFENHFTIQLKHENFYYYHIIGLDGKVIATGYFFGSHDKIDTAFLNCGLYILIINDRLNYSAINLIYKLN